MTRRAASSARTIADLRGLDWDNLAERIAPELRVDILPEWVVAQYRRLFPAYGPADSLLRRDHRRPELARPGDRGRGPRPRRARRPGSISSISRRRSSPQRGAPHTLDIPLVFGTLDAPGSIAGTGRRLEAVSAAMMDAFVAFARHGDPNHRGIPRWPHYDLAKRRDDDLRCAHAGRERSEAGRKRALRPGALHPAWDLTYFPLSPWGRGRGEGVLRPRLASSSEPPHPNPLPAGERVRVRGTQPTFFPCGDCTS